MSKPSKKTIFLVDDQKIANFINIKLLNVCGINDLVFDFVDPILALSEISKYKPDIILLDLQMPQMNGWSFLEELQKSKIHTKVVIVTSSESPLDKERSLKYHQVVDYCIKPLSTEVMREIIASV